MVNICEDMIDVYFVFVEFYKMFKKFKDSNEILVSCFLFLRILKYCCIINYLYFILYDKLFVFFF